jgi:hypothetical protein
MRIHPAALLVVVTIAALLESNLVLAKKPSRPRSVSASQGSSRSSRSGSTERRSSERDRAPVSRRRPPVYEEEPEDEVDTEEAEAFFEGDFDEEDVDFFGEEEEDEPEVLKPVPSKGRKNGGFGSRRPPPSSRTTRDTAIHRSSSSSRKRPPAARSRIDDEDEEDFRRPPPSRGRPPARGKPSGGSRGRPPPRNDNRDGRRPSGRSRSVVPYQKPGAGAAASLTKGFNAIRSSLPDSAVLRDAAAASFNAARETTSGLSANIYREVKGLTSSELEQVMLKATRPDDTPVKGKHVERLVGVTYQISARYDIYDAVLRKLWGKMAEKDWRTSIKSLYILHRFSSDGAPEHAPALKARLRELRRTRDPKRKDKFFNSKQLLSGDARPENIKFRAFMSRYAHYVLLRTQCFGGMFDEISQLPKVEKKKAPKPVTSTTLRAEHLEAAAMLLKAGVACQLKDGEECENTAIAAERVASDLIGLTSAVAIALNRALKGDDLKGADPVLLKKWCEFYSEELLPQTRAMVKKTSPKLDAYGLFLPSRMGTSVAPEVLQRGLHLEEEEEEPAASLEEEEEEASQEAEESTSPVEVKKESKPTPDEEESTATAVEEEEEEEEKETAAAVEEEEEVEEEAAFDEEYEYDEEEYYDDEEL